MARNAVHSALFLISSLVSVAALFILLGAEFIAGVQILVYVGGVMVLFLFVIMLVNVARKSRAREEIFNKPRQVTASLIFCLLLVAGLLFAINTAIRGLQKRDEAKLSGSAEQRSNAAAKSGRRERTGTSRITTDTQRVGDSLYRYASLPFEIASVLLLVAIIGSVMLARTLKQEAAVDDVDPEVLQAETARTGTDRRDLRRVDVDSRISMLNVLRSSFGFLFQEADGGRLAYDVAERQESRPVEVSGDWRVAFHHRRRRSADAAQHHRHLHVDRVDSQCRESELHCFLALPAGHRKRERGRRPGLRGVCDRRGRGRSSNRIRNRDRALPEQGNDLGG